MVALARATAAAAAAAVAPAVALVPALAADAFALAALSALVLTRKSFLERFRHDIIGGRRRGSGSGRSKAAAPLLLSSAA